MRKSDSRFGDVVAAFAGRRGVTCGEGRGFGANALKANGKIFAMLSSKDRFVVKLPRARVDVLVAGGIGKRFDPGHGRLMKEWLSVTSPRADWPALAGEAFDFAAGQKA